MTTDVSLPAAGAAPGGGDQPTPDEVARRDAILEAVGFAAECLLGHGGSWESCIDEVLARLGTAAGVSRVYIFENLDGSDGRPRGVQRHEWTAAGVTPQIDNPALLDLDYAAQGWSRWVDILSAGEVLHARTAELPPGERPELEAEDIVSLAVVPIMVGPRWWGFVGFDECVAPRSWGAELSALRAAASTLAAAVQQQRTRADLLEREAEYRQIFDSTGDGLLITDLGGVVIQANPAFCAMHGYTAEELIGQPSHRWIHPGDGDRLARYAEVVEGGGVVRVRGRDVRKDGTVFPVEVRASSFQFRGRRHVLRVVRDDTERARAFELLEQRVAALSAIAASMTVDQGLERTLDHLAEAAVGASSGIAAAVEIIDAATGRLEIAIGHGLPEGYTEGLKASWDLGVDSPSTQALRSQELRFIPDARMIGMTTPEFAPLQPLLPDIEWDDMVAIPLDSAGRSIGVLNVYYRKGELPPDDEVRFLRAVADQGAVAVENARLLDAAQRRAGLEERQRLARELHDSVSQALYGIALGARTARTLADRDPTKVVEPLDYLLSLADAALSEMRALIFELRPESLADEGLVGALTKQAAALRSRHSLAVDLEADDEPAVALPVKEALYRIAQEALHNTVKHARASRIAVTLRTDGAMVTLVVTDDGQGFDPSGSFPGHLGLSSMRERAQLFGGAVTIDSAPGRGTTVTATIAAAA